MRSPDTPKQNSERLPDTFVDVIINMINVPIPEMGLLRQKIAQSQQNISKVKTEIISSPENKPKFEQLLRDILDGNDPQDEGLRTCLQNQLDATSNKEQPDIGADLEKTVAELRKQVAELTKDQLDNERTNARDRLIDWGIGVLAAVGSLSGIGAVLFSYQANRLAQENAILALEQAEKQHIYLQAQENRELLAAKRSQMQSCLMEIQRSYKEFKSQDKDGEKYQIPTTTKIILGSITEPEIQMGVSEFDKASEQRTQQIRQELLKFVLLSDLHNEVLEAIWQVTNFENIDASEIDLKGKYLRGIHLAGANLSKNDLTGTNLRFANLDGASLPEAAKMQQTSLSRASLEGAQIPNDRWLFGTPESNFEEQKWTTKKSEDGNISLEKQDQEILRQFAEVLNDKSEEEIIAFIEGNSININTLVTKGEKHYYLLGYTFTYQKKKLAEFLIDKNGRYFSQNAVSAIRKIINETNNFSEWQPLFDRFIGGIPKQVFEQDATPLLEYALLTDNMGVFNQIAKKAPLEGKQYMLTTLFSRNNNISQRTQKPTEKILILEEGGQVTLDDSVLEKKLLRAILDDNASYTPEMLTTIFIQSFKNKKFLQKNIFLISDGMKKRALNIDIKKRKVGSQLVSNLRFDDYSQIHAKIMEDLERLDAAQLQEIQQALETGYTSISAEIQEKIEIDYQSLKNAISELISKKQQEETQE